MLNKHARQGINKCKSSIIFYSWPQFLSIELVNTNVLNKSLHRMWQCIDIEDIC